MSEITREYLEEIDFGVEDAKGADPLCSFVWERTKQGHTFWALADLAQSKNLILPQVPSEIIAEMIRVWEATEPQPEAPAIEYCVTAGEGRLIDYGVTTEPLEFTGWYEEVKNSEQYWRGENLTKLHIAPTTTSCMTGK